METETTDTHVLGICGSLRRESYNRRLLAAAAKELPDACPDHALHGKPVIVVGASISAFGAALAQAELRRVLKAVGADVLDAQLPVPRAHEAFAADGRLADPQIGSQLASMVLHLVCVTHV